MSFKISPRSKPLVWNFLDTETESLAVSCRVVRRRVRKTAVSSAMLIEEFDSFLGEYFLVPVSFYECIPRFLVSSCLAAVFEKIWSKMKMGFRVFVGFVHELLLFLRKNLIENENEFYFFWFPIVYSQCTWAMLFSFWFLMNLFTYPKKKKKRDDTNILILLGWRNV